MLTTLKDQICRTTCWFSFPRLLLYFTQLLYIICRLLCMFAVMSVISFGLFTKTDCAITIPQHWWPAWNLSPRAWCNSFLRLHAYSSGQSKYCVKLWEKWGKLTNKRSFDRMTWIGSGERARDGVPQLSCGLGPSPFCKDSIAHGQYKYRATRATAITTWSCWSTLLYLFLRYHLNHAFQLFYI